MIFKEITCLPSELPLMIFISPFFLF